MFDNIFGMILVCVIVLIVFSLLVFIIKRYKKCPSDRVMVIYGKVGSNKDGTTRSAKCIHGGAAFIWPVIQAYEFLDLTPMSISVDLENALSRQNIRINVPSRFTVGVSTEPGVMQNAAERLLGLKLQEIQELAKDIIFGQLRLVIATMDIEEINTDRDKFLEAVSRNVEGELKKIGLRLINVNVTDISDESGYIDALGKEAAAKAINDAIAGLQRIPDLSADTYAVNIAASEHGKVSANLSNASAGSVITLTATPDEGYELLSISVRDADGKPVALDGMKFTMPESSVTVTAVFGQGGLPFVDVSANAWYYETVKAAYEAGLMNGVTDTEFAPNAPLTRAMIWTILARASGVETDGGATWYAKAQEWAVTNGVSDGEDPLGNVTREQLVTMLWRLNGSEVMTGYIGNYIDTGDISEWANQAMLWAVQNGIIEGDENMALAPKADTTRAQAATFFVRYLTVA